MRELPSSSPAVVVYTAVESTDKPVKIEVEILRRPTNARTSGAFEVSCDGVRGSPESRISSARPGYASLHETGCSVLICEARNVL